MLCHIPGPVNSAARSAEVGECFAFAGLCRILKAEESDTSSGALEPRVLLWAAGNHRAL